MCKIHIKSYFVQNYLPQIILPSFCVWKELTFSWIGKQNSVYMNTSRFRRKKEIELMSCCFCQNPIWSLHVKEFGSGGTMPAHSQSCRNSELSPANTQCSSILFSAYLFFRICSPLLHTAQFIRAEDLRSCLEKICNSSLQNNILNFTIWLDTILSIKDF